MAEDFLGQLEFMIIAALIPLRSNAYGVTIRDRIKGDGGRTLALGSIYTTLDRMEKKGLVRSHEGGATQLRGGRRKRYFELTAKGQEAFNNTRLANERLMRGIPAPTVGGAKIAAT